MRLSHVGEPSGSDKGVPVIIGHRPIMVSNMHDWGVTETTRCNFAASREIHFCPVWPLITMHRTVKGCIHPCLHRGVQREYRAVVQTMTTARPFLCLFHQNG